MDDVKQHIYLPIPDLKGSPRPGSETRDDRLRAIIANLDQQHQQVRDNIATASIRHYQTALQNGNRDEDTMDLGPITSPPRDTGVYSDATFHLIANLATPHDTKHGDPCLPPGGKITIPPGVRQVEPPAGMKAAMQTLDQIAVYDQLARTSREFYGRALERRGSGSRSGSYVGVGHGSANGNGVNGVNFAGAPEGYGVANGPNVHPDRVRQVDTSDLFGRRW
ncbi:hypothetical protein DOTSEDRAFT_31783 [Dothistroma septosporum NZE10]|uniref:Uncharacterized protein n=1 Tax=Dothistroma septosporum (strain NZE10 / CBS 128990) TaxID=675120 RepID=N1PWG8_DOTSN|nr:hypothetical protein DOTSEDRAFT_31783 [Dothistroma septosporum NZE10]